jgi:hypothetical protein
VSKGGFEVAEGGTAGRPSSALRRVLVPLALAQFICSFAGTNMNVMINDISEDLDTSVQGVQVAITCTAFPGPRRRLLQHRRAGR